MAENWYKMALRLYKRLPTGDYRCSECGYFTVDLVCVEDGEEGWTEIAPNYCSRCGAEMSL